MERSGMRRGRAWEGQEGQAAAEGEQSLGLSEADRQVRGPGRDLCPREEGREPGPPGLREEGRRGVIVSSNILSSAMAFVQ